MSPRDVASTSSDQANTDRDVDTRGATKLNCGSSNQGKHRGGHVNASSEAQNPPSSSRKPSRKTKPKRVHMPRLLSPVGTHASPTMDSGSFTSYQATPGNHVDNIHAYSSSHSVYGSVAHIGGDPAATDACLSMGRWLNENRQDEPFHAFNLYNGRDSPNTAAHDTFPMTRWLDQTRQDEPFRAFTMTHGDYSDDRAAGAYSDSLWAGCEEEPEEGDI
ncbi:hypothetical protein PG985_010476 [Apiospora marii]|uniref:Uncharacterized protein n=1 Tax=Apiospora marii TaxID=335849 RepID=A0ABR1S0U7_9PEZI